MNLTELAAFAKNSKVKRLPTAKKEPKRAKESGTPTQPAPTSSEVTDVAHMFSTPE